MRSLVLMLIFALVAAVPASAAPLPPVNGLYHSLTQGGTVLDGRFSESWTAPGGEGLPGNTLNAASWDGTALGTEWRITCASIAAAPTLVGDTRDANGTGEVTWQTSYAGGRFWLAAGGPWSADNLTDFTGSLQGLTVTSTHQYVGGIRIGIRSNVTMTGAFDQLYPTWGPTCMDYMISNTSVFGSTASGSLPADFPAFLDPAGCPPGSATLADGAWGDVTHITMLITGCAVPVEATTWSGIKSRF